MKNTEIEKTQPSLMFIHDIIVFDLQILVVAVEGSCNRAHGELAGLRASITH